MAKKDKMQMVDDDQIENVGIMSGFMDDLDEMMLEIDGEMQETDDGDEGDIAKMLGRRPDSPEILMNNLRGDYRSIDARREELADLVGYSAAAETPDEVLAMLQPVLAQQGIAALPQAAPMQPDMGAPAGIEALPMDQGPMPGAPMPGAPMPGAPMPEAPMMPPEQQAPVGMKRGGIVQFFQDGGEAETDDAYAAYPPDVVERALAIARQRLMNPPEAAAVPDVRARTRELAPMYAEILGTQDKDAVRSQMLFDIAQAALGFAGNVSPQGQPLTGSFAARLAGAASGLPAQISARSGAQRAAETQARLAALQQAQGEQSQALSSNREREKEYNELLMKVAGQKQPPQLLSPEEIRAAGLQEDLPWQFSPSTGYSIAGGRPAAPLVDMGENTLEKVGTTKLVEGLVGQYDNATAAGSNIRRIDETIKLLEESDPYTGFGAEFRLKLERLQQLFSEDPESLQRLTDTELLNSALGTNVFGAISSLGVGARGLDTPAEREFLRDVLAGRITLTKKTLLEMARTRRRAEENSIKQWNDTLASGRANSLIEASQGMLQSTPLAIPSTYTESPEDVRQRVNELLGR
jgi:hypothetical protein